TKLLWPRTLLLLALGDRAGWTGRTRPRLARDRAPAARRGMTRWTSTEEGPLLGPERHHGIHAHRAARGNDAGQEGGRDHEEEHSRKRGGVRGADAEEQA